MLYALGAAVVIIGIVIFVAQIWQDIGSFGRISVTLGLGFLISAIGSMLLKQKPEDNIGAIFHFIGGMLIPGGTAFAYLIVEAVVEGAYYRDLYAYLTMVIGASYLLLAHAFREGRNKNLIGVLRFFGSAGLLGAAFTQTFDSGLWQLLYFFVVFAGLFLSVHIRSSIVLVMSSIFLIAHISYITNLYFADSIGWALSLLIICFLKILQGRSE